MKKILLSLVVFSFLTVFSTNQAQAKPVMLTGQSGCVFVTVLIDIEVDGNGGYNYEVLDIKVGSNCKETQATLFEQQVELIKKAFKAKKITKNQKDSLMKKVEELK